MATSSGQKFSEVLAQFDLSAVKSIETAVSISTPAIGEIARQIKDNRPIRAYVAGHIVALRDFVNLRGAMTDDQTILTAELVLSEFPNVTLADVALIFRRAKLGQYGEFYGRLDGQMILSWFGKYFEERCGYCSEKSISKANSEKGRDMDTPARVKLLVDSLMPKMMK